MRVCTQCLVPEHAYLDATRIRDGQVVQLHCSGAPRALARQRNGDAQHLLVCAAAALVVVLTNHHDVLASDVKCGRQKGGSVYFYIKPLNTCDGG